jgi:hypothetical protein
MVWGASVGAAHSHQAGHQPGSDLDYDLHDSDVIEHCKERADKDDGWQNLERKIKTQMRSLFAKISKDKLRADKGIAEQAVDSVASLLEEGTAEFNLENKKGEGNLQAEAPAYRF